MTINYAALCRYINGVLQIIYPKTIADLVEYDSTQNIKDKIDSIEAAKVNISDIVNDLITSALDKPLSAEQGVVLKQLIDGIIDTYIPLTQKGSINGVAELNGNGKVPAEQLPNYTDVNYVPSDTVADLTAKQIWQSEQTYNYIDYGLILTDTINGVACGYKAPRGLFNQLFVDDIVFTNGSTGTDAAGAEEIGFYRFNGVKSKAAEKDSDGNITTEGYNNLLEYEKVAAITRDGGLVLRSSTSGSSKFFEITINDNGQLNIAEYQNMQ